MAVTARPRHTLTPTLILAVRSSEIRGINDLTRQESRQGAVNQATESVRSSEA